MKIGSLAAICLAGVVAACASSGPYEMSEAVQSELSKYEKTGATESCVLIRAIDRIDPLDERNLLFYMRGGDVYLNEVSGVCGGAGRVGNRLQYETTASSLCRNDIIRVFDNQNNFAIGSCGVNDFIELAVPATPVME